MELLIHALSDIGVYRESNQDSVLIKTASYQQHMITMAIICDGMGGLSNGELASATIVRSFDRWFEVILPQRLSNAFDCEVNLKLTHFSEEWITRLGYESNRLKEYSHHHGISMGTTFSGILVIDDEYMLVHVGDSRVYQIDHQIKRLTEDHTYVAREIAAGRLTPQEAKRHPRRNTLLQCVGASKILEPDILFGRIEYDTVFLLCSDGFWHYLSDDMLQQLFSPYEISSKRAVDTRCRTAIQKVISSGEKDNISIAVIRTFSTEVNKYA